MPREQKYTRLLRYLFERGLSPASESMVDGFSEFFKDSHWEAVVQKHSPVLTMVRSIGNGLVECLGSSNYRVTQLAARILRDYINSMHEMPGGCIERLIAALDVAVPSSAMQVALTLGCIACTKPSIGFRPPSIPLVDYVVMEPCWQCPGGYSRGKYARSVVPALIRNLSRPMSRDRKNVQLDGLAQQP